MVAQAGSEKSKLVSLKRHTEYRDEEGIIRKCKISFSLNIQQTSERPNFPKNENLTAISDLSLASTSEPLSCNEIVTRSSRNASTKCFTFKRKILFHEVPRGRKRKCFVRFFLSQESDVLEQTRRNKNLTNRVLGGLNVYAPRSCFRCEKS